MHYVVDDTIVAIASAPGGGPRGIVRLTGPRMLDCVSVCFRPAAQEDLYTIRRATRIVGELLFSPPLPPLPGDLYLWPTTRSYTRQPTAELHTIGAVPLLDAAVQLFCEQGARLAQPGEFTLRAFLAGRLDLSQAEAVLGVIDATTAETLQVALRQLAGGVGCHFQRLREELLELLAHIEAGLDFADEPIEFIAQAAISAQLAKAALQVQRLQEQLAERADVEHEFRVVLRGAPNAGKSRLFNALVGTEAALVAPHSGTTRDFVSHSFSWHGVAGLLIDTAGFEACPENAVAQAAQRVADDQSAQAQLEIVCLDATRKEDASAERARGALTTCPRIVVWTKGDLLADRSGVPPEVVLTSGLTGEGLDTLRTEVARRLTGALDTRRNGEMVASTAVRCRESLTHVRVHLKQASEVVAVGAGDELVASHLHAALDHLGQIVGVVYTDDLLDRIFSRFCIGK